MGLFDAQNDTLNLDPKAVQQSLSRLNSMRASAPPPAPPEPEEKSSLLRRAVADPALGLLKGAIGVPEFIVGLADIATGGYAGKGAEVLGFKPKEAKEIISSWQSPELNQAREKVGGIKGFVPTAKAMAENPSTILDMAAESAPSMIGAGGVARGAVKMLPKLAPVVAAGIGEGLVSAGQTAEQVRQSTPDGLLSPKQMAAPLTSGALTALIGVAGGKVANKLGIADIDTMLTTGRINKSQHGLLRRVAEGVISEGVLEELPQSAQEQVAQNISLNRPWNEGVANAAASGMMVGGAMGGGSNVISGRETSQDRDTPTETITSTHPAVAAARAEALEALALAADPTNDLGVSDAVQAVNQRKAEEVVSRSEAASLEPVTPEPVVTPEFVTTEPAALTAENETPAPDLFDSLMSAAVQDGGVALSKREEGPTPEMVQWAESNGLEFAPGKLMRNMEQRWWGLQPKQEQVAPQEVSPSPVGQAQVAPQEPTSASNHTPPPAGQYRQHVVQRDEQGRPLVVAVERPDGVVGLLNTKGGVTAAFENATDPDHPYIQAYREAVARGEVEQGPAPNAAFVKGTQQFDGLLQEVAAQRITPRKERVNGSKTPTEEPVGSPATELDGGLGRNPVEAGQLRETETLRSQSTQPQNPGQTKGAQAETARTVRDIGSLPVAERLAALSQARGETLTESTNKALADKLDKIAQIFGHRVTLLSLPEGNSYDGFVADADPKHVYISENSQNHPLAVLGHEILHQMKKADKNLYYELAQALDAMKNKKGFKEYMGRTGEVRSEEWVADVFGKAFSHEGFWQAFETESPSLAGRVATFVHDLITRFKDKLLTGRTGLAAQTIKDFRKVERLTAEVARRYAENVKRYESGEMSEAGFKELSSVSSDDIPSHIINAVAAPREVMTAVSTATKQQTKDTLNEKLKSREIPHTNPIRLTTVEELHDIIKTGTLRAGKDFEGRSGISAQLVDGKKPIVAYGPNDKISAAIVFPEQAAIGKGMAPNEVKVSEKTDVTDLHFVVGGFRELMSFDQLKEAMGEKQDAIGFKELTSLNPVEQARGINRVFRDIPYGRVLKDAMKSAYRFFMPMDRTVNLLASMANYKPIQTQLKQFLSQRKGKAGYLQAAMTNAHHVIKTMGKAFTTEADEKKLADLAFTATLYQVHADPRMADGWTEDTWVTSGQDQVTGKSLDEARREVRAMYNALTPAQKKAHRAMLDHFQHLRDDAKNHALDPVKQLFGDDVFSRAQQYLTNEKQIVASGVEVPQLVKDAAKAIKTKMQAFPELKGDYVPLMRFGNYQVRINEVDENGEMGKRTYAEFFDTKEDALRFIAGINQNTATSGQTATLEVSDDKLRRAHVNVPGSYADQIKDALQNKYKEALASGDADTQALIESMIEAAHDEAQAIRVNTLPRTTTEGSKLHREGVAGFSRDIVKVFATFSRNNALANSRLIYGEQINQTFRDMKNVIKAFDSEPSEPGQEKQHALMSADMQDAYNWLYRMDKEGDQEKVHELAQVLGKASAFWYLSSPSTWLVQWSQPFIFTVPHMAARFGFPKALTEYTKAAKRYMAGNYSDEKIDEFDRTHEFVGKRMADLVEQSRTVPERERSQINAELKSIYESFPDPKDREMLALKVLSHQNAVDLSAAHMVQDLTAGATDGSKTFDKLVNGSAWFMQHSESGSRRAAAVSSFNMAFKKDDDFLKANDYAVDTISKTLYDFDSSNRGEAWRGSWGRVFGIFRFFQLHTIGQLVQLSKDALGAEFKRDIAEANGDQAKIKEAKDRMHEARMELAYIMGSSFALAGALGTPLSTLFSNSAMNLIWAGLGLAFGDDDDPWDPRRDFEMMVRRNLNSTAADVVLKGLPSLVGADVSRRIGLGNMGDLINGEPPPGISSAQKFGWYAGRALGPAGGMVMDGVRVLDELEKGNLVEAIRYGTPKGIRDMVKAFQVATDGVKSGGNTIMKGEDVSPYSFALMIMGVNPLDVSLAQEESRYLKNISAVLSQRRAGLVKDLAEAGVNQDEDAKEAAIEEINRWQQAHPKLQITMQNVVQAIKRRQKSEENVPTKREQIIQEEYGMEGGEDGGEM